MTENSTSVNLLQVDPSLRKLRVGLGWQAPEKVGLHDLDIDACLFALNRDNRVREDLDFIFYNNTKSIDGAIVHSGDSLKGRGTGDDEVIDIELDRLSYDIEKLVFTISIHNAVEREETFQNVTSGFIRLVNAETQLELVQCPLSKENSDAIAYQFASLTRADGNGWLFEHLQMPHPEGLYGISRDLGVNVAEP